MKNAEIFYRPIGNSGPLAIYWHPGPYGNAIESKEGTGVIWQTANGELLGVEFDDVNADADHQKMTAPGGDIIEISIKNRKIKWALKRISRSHRHFKQVGDLQILHA